MEPISTEITTLFVPQGNRVPVPPFRRVYEENFDFVFRMARRFGTPERSVDDVVQEVFLVVHRKLVEFEGRSSLRTWLYTITRRVVRDHGVKRGNRALGSEIDEGQHASAETGPEEALERRRALAAVDRILASMDDARREVFLLAEMEGFTGGEIADALGMNPNTVYTNLRLARQEFAEAVHRHRLRAERGRHG